MKKPLLNEEQRRQIRAKTLNGATLELGLAYQHVRREAYKNGGFFYWVRIRRSLIKIINLKLFGRS